MGSGKFESPYKELEAQSLDPDHTGFKSQVRHLLAGSPGKLRNLSVLSFLLVKMGIITVSRS